jgi:hypothetical protein
MAKGIHTIEVRIVSLLRHNKGTRMSSTSIARQLGVKKKTVENGIGKIQINVLLPNELVVKSGPKGNSKYELESDKTLTCDIFDLVDKEFRSMDRKGIKLVKALKIAYKTRNRNEIAKVQKEIRSYMMHFSQTASNVALLELPLANI